MKVAIIGDYPLDATQIRGGVQAAFAYLVKGLAQIDPLELHVLTLKPSVSATKPGVEQNGITLHLIPPFPRFEFAKNYRTYQACLNEKLAQIQPDVVHAQDAAADAYVALRSGYPAVITVHGVWRENSKYIKSLRQRIRHFLHSLFIERYNLKRTYHLIAISRYVTKYFSDQLRPEAQIYYIPNAINESFFELDRAPQGQTVLFAGRIILRKRPLDLVQAFAKIAQQFPAAQLRLAGEYSSEPSYTQSILNFIESNGLTDRVRLLGPLPEETVLQEFANCDLLVLPASQETAPMVIAQAMAAAKPVVATPVGGVAEMVQPEETGFLVPVGNIDDLSQAMHRLLHDQSLRISMGQAGQQFAVENYREDIVARRTWEVYQKIAMIGS